MEAENSRDGYDGVPFLVQLLAACVSIAEKTGTTIRDISKTGDLRVVEKGHNDFQTEADRSAEELIIASLLTQFPGITIVGEEGTNYQAAEVKPDWLELGKSASVIDKCMNNVDGIPEANLEDVVVWVDPLDATYEYTKGLFGDVTTLIGIGVNGKATAGVIHQPFFEHQESSSFGRSTWGMLGVGSFDYKVYDKPDGKGNNVVVITRMYENQETADSINAFKASDVIKAGGCGTKVLMVLERRVHAYLDASWGCMKWDTCAPEAILEAVGGKLTDIHGRRINYEADVQTANSGGVIATADGTDHQWYLEKIPHNVLEKLPELIDKVYQAENKSGINSKSEYKLENEISSTKQSNSEERPSHGKMNYEVDRRIQLPGHEGTGAIVVSYNFPATERCEDSTFLAYLPNSPGGREILQLLRKAFDLGLTFQYDEESGVENQLRRVIWSDIPHKGNIEGGIERNGYPDSGYITQLRKILHDKGLP